MLRLLAALIAGMICAWLVPVIPNLAYGLALPALSVLLWPASKKPGWLRLELQGFCLLLLFLIGGYRLMHDAQLTTIPPPGPQLSYCQPLDAWQTSSSGWKNRSALTVRRGNQWVKYPNQVMLYLRREEFPQPPATNFLVYTQIHPPRSTHNPGAFDYAAYLKDQGVLNQALATKDSMLPLPNKPGFHPAERLKNSLVAGLRRCVFNPRELGLAEALLIGYRDDMDKGLTTAYSNAGVVHVIAISGLHLALIYSLLMGLVNLFPWPPWLHWMKFLLVLAGLWIFSFAAGAQPSVIRSAVMFSLAGLGQLLARRRHTLYTLAAVAFIMLAVHPLWLRDVGFQLSFAALTGILLHQKKLNALWMPQHPLLHAVCGLCTVTLAAQVYTVPLCLYYFHQLPVLFLVTNMIIVPFSSLVLVLALLAIISLPLLPAHAVLSAALDWGLRFMNEFVHYMNRCPFISWQGLMIGLVQAICLTAFLHCLLVRRWKLALPALLGFTNLAVLASCAAQQQQGLILYDAGRSWALELVTGRRSRLYCDSAFLSAKNLDYILKPAAIKLGFERREIITSKGNRLGIHYDGKKILFVTGSGPVPPSTILQKFNPSLLIVSGGLSASQRRYWSRQASLAGVPVHDIPSQGAVIMLPLRPSDPASPWTRKFNQRLFQFFTKTAWSP